MQETGKVAEASAVVDDLSITLLAGRVVTPAPALQQAIDAERLGFKRVWIPERYSNKEAGTLLGAMAASTSRIGVASGPLSISSRPPVVFAALGSTMQELFGPRLTLGVGRGGPPSWYQGHGFSQVSYEELIDRVDIMKRLWAGETIEKAGPAGDYRGLRMPDPLNQPPPEIVFFHMGGPKASAVAANPIFNAVALPNTLSPDGVARSIEMTRRECERIGRDPATLHMIACVTTAPALDEVRTQVEVLVRILVYIALPILGDMLIQMNRWDQKVVDRIRNHPAVVKARNSGTTFDQSFRREELVGLALELVPRDWPKEVAAMGSIEECVRMCQRYKDAGATELDFYGSSPEQNAGLIQAWRKHRGL